MVQARVMTTASSVRERVRAELTREILEVAHVHLGREGATGLSLRAVARDLGMVPSALYRYYPNRDALLSALILDAYGSLARSVEDAGAAAHEAELPEGEQWMVVTAALRAWAVGFPHEWALIFGSPVPGYEAPQDTVIVYARVAEAIAHPVLEAHRSGRLTPSPVPRADASALSDAVRPVAEFLVPTVPGELVALLLTAWSQLIGVISLEVFGHWRNTVLDPPAFFDYTSRTMAQMLGLPLGR
jgi:AcrR family transcriptional regulator